MADIRGEAMKLINEVGPNEVVYSNDKKITGNGKTKFENITGYSEKGINTLWDTMPGMSTCFAQVNVYSDRLRYMVGVINRPKLGNITPGLQGYLASLGYSHAFMPSTEGVFPYPGDVLHHKIQHVDVVVACDGVNITCLAGGQGNPSTRLDKVNRYTTGFDVNNYVGWCDIEVLYGPKPSVKTKPDWLIGHYWEVIWRGTEYYYYFDKNGKVVWCEYGHTDWVNPPFVADGVGRYIYDDNAFNTGITIYWNSGSVETFTRNYPSSAPESMNGLWNWGEPLRALQLT